MKGQKSKNKKSSKRERKQKKKVIVPPSESDEEANGSSDNSKSSKEELKEEDPKTYKSEVIQIKKKFKGNKEMMEVPKIKMIQKEVLNIQEDISKENEEGAISYINGIYYMETAKKIIINANHKCYIFNGVPNYNLEAEIDDKYIEIDPFYLITNLRKLWIQVSQYIYIYSMDNYQKETTIDFGEDFFGANMELAEFSKGRILIKAEVDVCVLDEFYEFTSYITDNDKWIGRIAKIDEKSFVALTGTQTKKIKKYDLEKKQWDPRAIDYGEELPGLNMIYPFSIKDNFLFFAAKGTDEPYKFKVKKIALDTFELVSDIIVDPSLISIGRLEDSFTFFKGSLILTNNNILLCFSENLMYYMIENILPGEIKRFTSFGENSVLLVDEYYNNVKIFKMEEDA